MRKDGREVEKTKKESEGGFREGRRRDRGEKRI